MITQAPPTRSRAWRSRWAAVGAAVAVTLGAGGLMIADAAPSEESSFVSIEPTRVLDTRTDVGLSGPFVSGVAQKLRITGTVPTQPPNDLPPVEKQVIPAGATSVTLNVTVVRPGSRGFLSIRPGDATGVPATSNINFGADSPNVANSVTVSLPTAGDAAGVLDIYVNGTAADVLIDVAGYFLPFGGDEIDAKSNKKNDIADPPAGNYGVAMSVTVEADSVGIIQIVGSALVVTAGAEDQLNCRLTRGDGATTNDADDDLADTDRGEHLDANQTGACATNGTVAVGAGSHIINLVVKRDAVTSDFDDGTLQALFIPGGVLDNSDG